MQHSAAPPISSYAPSSSLQPPSLTRPQLLEAALNAETLAKSLREAAGAQRPVLPKSSTPARWIIQATAKRRVGTGWHEYVLKENLVDFCIKEQISITNKLTRDQLVTMVERSGRVPAPVRNVLDMFYETPSSKASQPTQPNLQPHEIPVPTSASSNGAGLRPKAKFSYPPPKRAHADTEEFMDMDESNQPQGTPLAPTDMPVPCPECNMDMIARQNRVNQLWFWGFRMFPACRGTRTYKDGLAYRKGPGSGHPQA